jgi:4'-phosphopantetheinyl transferase
MNVYWLEQCREDVPQGNDWLSSREVRFLQGLRFDRRRADWRLGRWTGKRAVALHLNLPYSPAALAAIEIRPASSGTPEAFFENKPVAVTISLSHRDDRAICALAPSGSELGCDLEAIEPHSDAFLADYFTVEEQAFVTARSLIDRTLFVALLWSAKESVLKALREGLRLDTRSVMIELTGPQDLSTWNSFQARCKGGQVFHGWWQIANDMVRTVAAAPRPTLPIALSIPPLTSDRSSRDSDGRATEHHVGLCDRSEPVLEVGGMRKGVS